MPIKRCGGGCGGFERGEGGHNGTENKKAHLSVSIFDTAYGGTRRTVVGCEAPILARLEFGGFFDVPQRVSIKKSASYGFLWNRIGNFGALSIAAMREDVWC